MDEKLKPCPACGNRNVHLAAIDEQVFCAYSDDCGMTGPGSDRDGSKWNALPRRTDAPAGMSDGELITRALREVACEIDLCHTNRSSGWDLDVSAELDRRAAARKEATK